MPRTFTSLKEIQKFYFPNSFPNFILERLEEKFSFMGRHRLSKAKNNPKTGTLEVIKPYFFTLESLLDRIKSFYRSEGYKVYREFKNGIGVRNKDEHYEVLIMDKVGSYSILILESPRFDKCFI